MSKSATEVIEGLFATAAIDEVSAPLAGPLRSLWEEGHWDVDGIDGVAQADMAEETK
jgi:hypothetical protein